MSTSFIGLGLPESLATALSKRQITEPFPIQAQAIPDALRGRDIRGQAPTGSGKTLAFGLPLLARLGRGAGHRPRALVLAPTRELAEQINRELDMLARAVDRRIMAIYGGVSYAGQKAGLRRGVDVLVATPGRLEDLIGQRQVDLSAVDIVVVDEADRMADMGFLPAVRRLLDQTSKQRQTMLFSATLDGDVAVLSREYQSHPMSVAAGADGQETIEAVHHFWGVHRDDRIRQTADVINASGRTIVFTRTRRGADRLARQLARSSIAAMAMHGGRSQNQRNRALKAFASGSVQALVATDVAARGIHVDAVNCVIHYDVAGDHKDYLHRSGRTARAGAAGTVVSMVMPDQEREVRRMQRHLQMETSIVPPQLEHLHRPSGVGVASKRKPAAASHPGHPNQGTRSIYVGNLPWRTSNEDLAALFGLHGEVRSATVVTQGSSGRSKGYGFVEMPEVDSHGAIAALRHAQLGGRDLKVRFAR